jgi:hypothetical protein
MNGIRLVKKAISRNIGSLAIWRGDEYMLNFFQDELDNSEAMKRIQYKAALLTLDDSGQKI